MKWLEDWLDSILKAHFCVSKNSDGLCFPLGRLSPSWPLQDYEWERQCSAAPDSLAVCQPCSSDVSNSSPPLTPLGSTCSCPNKQLVCLHAKQIAPKSRYCFFWSTFMFISKIRDAAFFRQATLKFLLELLTPVSSLRNQLLPFFFPSMPEQHCKLHRCWNFPG